MKFLSVYKTVEKDVLPAQEEMARMGKLIEDGMKADQNTQARSGG